MGKLSKLQQQQQQQQDNNMLLLNYVIKSIQMKECILLPYLSEIIFSSSSSDNNDENIIHNNHWYDIIEDDNNEKKYYPLLIENLDDYHLYIHNDDSIEFNNLYDCYRLYIDMISYHNTNRLVTETFTTDNDKDNEIALSANDALQYFNSNISNDDDDSLSSTTIDIDITTNNNYLLGISTEDQQQSIKIRNIEEH